MMNTTKTAARRLILGATAVALCFGLAACGTQTPTQKDAPSEQPGASQLADADKTPPADNATAQPADQKTDQVAEPGAYVSDEQCLSCHGESYEALAETTESYGLSNPHDSIHGGPNACVNCHAKDKEITDNQCTHCHDWPHNPESGLGAH